MPTPASAIPHGNTQRQRQPQRQRQHTESVYPRHRGVPTTTHELSNSRRAGLTPKLMRKSWKASRMVWLRDTTPPIQESMKLVRHDAHRSGTCKPKLLPMLQPLRTERAVAGRAGSRSAEDHRCFACERSTTRTNSRWPSLPLQMPPAVSSQVCSPAWLLQEPTELPAVSSLAQRPQRQSAWALSALWRASSPEP